MLNRELESILRTQVAQNKPVPSSWAKEMLDTIDALRAQVAQLQIDVQQANAQIATEIENCDAERWADAVRTQDDKP